MKHIISICAIVLLLLSGTSGFASYKWMPNSNINFVHATDMSAKGRPVFMCRVNVPKHGTFLGTFTRYNQSCFYLDHNRKFRAERRYQILTGSNRALWQTTQNAPVNVGVIDPKTKKPVTICLGRYKNQFHVGQRINGQCLSLSLSHQSNKAVLTSPLNLAARRTSNAYDWRSDLNTTFLVGGWRVCMSKYKKVILSGRVVRGQCQISSASKLRLPIFRVLDGPKKDVRWVRIKKSTHNTVRSGFLGTHLYVCRAREGSKLWPGTYDNRQCVIVLNDGKVVNKRQNFELLSRASNEKLNPIKPVRRVPWPRGKRCASENGLCTIKQESRVYYGAGKKWHVQLHFGPVKCSNKVFGDPIRGTVKSCWVQPVDNSKPVRNPTIIKPTIQWVRFKGRMPTNPFVAGYHKGKHKLFVCRAMFKGGQHPGKVWKNRCNIGYGGKEYTLKKFDVLVASKVRWGAASSKKAVIGGYQRGRTLKVCRAKYKRGLHPGKVWGNRCNIGYGGREIVIRSYNVLVQQ